ncbi:MAG: DHH family phosphoesterase [Christensenellales bacterium]|jgi:single-stranded-DNA-specific exonuclease
MQFQLIGKNDYLINPIEVILHNRGIKNIDNFLTVNKNHTYHYSQLKNIDKAVDCLLEHLQNNNIMFIQIDGDCDGFTSSALLFNYIKLIYPNSNIIWNTPKGKEHGIILDKIPEDVSLVISPDAGSNDYEQHKELKEKGIECLVLDHHETKKESSNAIIVNNQIGNYPNSQLSGVGVVYKLCQALDDRLNVKYADQFLDLVALGSIADVMDLRSLETRYYVLEGLKKINNPFVQALFEKQSYFTKGIINIINVAFYIAPLINACVRFGTQEEKENMFKAFIGSEETLPYKKRGEKEETQQPIAEAMARICANVKARQNRERDKNLDVIEQRIKEKKLLENKILIVDVTEILEQTLTGLVATQLAEKYKRPVILLRFNAEKNHYGGSARGYDKGVIKNIKQFLLDSKKFIYALGHPNACGVGITYNNIIEVNNIFNSQLKNVIFEDIYNVDFIIPSNKITSEFVLNLNKYADIWGGGVDEPLIAFTGLVVIVDDISILGQKQNTIKFIHRNIEFIKFNCNEEQINKIKNNGKTVEIDVVGRCKTNEFNGNISAQVIISDFNVKQTKKFVF